MDIDLESNHRDTMKIERVLFFLLLLAVMIKGVALLRVGMDVVESGIAESGLADNGQGNQTGMSQHNGQSVASGPIVTIKIDGTINPAVDDYVKTSLERAKMENAQLFIIEINTPGGLLNSMESITKNLLESPIPTVVFVGPAGSRAVSAGMFITLAAHFAVMAPGTTIGAAHPVTSDGGNVQSDMRDKLENYVSSFARSIAEQRSRNVEWADKAVRESVAITDREALEKGVINFISSDMDHLISELEGRSVSIQGRNINLDKLAKAKREFYPMTFKQKVVNLLADPSVAVLLGLAAVLGIMMELYHPGTAVPGVIGVICLVLSLTASQVIPINYGGIALLILGTAFVVAELYVPSFGIWGIAGTICFILGAIYAVDTDLVWSADSYGVERAYLAAFALFVGGLITSLALYVKKHRRGVVMTGSEGLVGVAGEIISWSLDKKRNYWSGKVRVHNELWHARTASVEKGVGDDRIKGSSEFALEVGSKIRVKSLLPGMVLEVVADPSGDKKRVDEKE